MTDYVLSSACTYLLLFSPDSYTPFPISNPSKVVLRQLHLKQDKSKVALNQTKIFFFPGKHPFGPIAWSVFKDEYSLSNYFIFLAQVEYHVLDASKRT